MRPLVFVVIALLLVASVAAAGVLIMSESKSAGLNNAAFYIYHDGRSEDAEQLYRMALNEEPSYQLARYNLATLLFQESRFPEAASELEMLIAQDPANAQYHYDLAVNLIENIRQQHEGLDQFDRAIAEYETAAQLQPGIANVKENLAVLYRIRSSAQS